jgi:release factor glutamine methyltransferase
MNIRTLLEQFAQRDIPRSEVRLLIAHALQRDHAWLVTHDDEALDTSQVDAIRILIARRISGEPIAYIVGYREFYGRRFKCTPAALIPRPETELLVEEVLAVVPSPWGGGLGRGSRLTPNESFRHTLTPTLPCRAYSRNNARVVTAVDRARSETPPSPPRERGLRILDIGTGTGCIAITLALELPSAHVTACDISRDALALARENAQTLNAKVNFVESDWFSAFNKEDQFDVIVSNPPYIAPNDPHLFQGDLRFEPWLALQDRGDGLQSYRELANGAKQHLRQGGVLIVEHGYDQGESVPALFREAGFVDVEMIRDLAGNARVTHGRFSAALLGRNGEV